MSTEQHATPAAVTDDGTDGLSLPELEQQIVERMSKLYPVAEEYYKLQVLLDTIDGRDVLPVPEFLVGRVAAVAHPTEEQRQAARDRVKQRIAHLARVQRGVG